jgi:UDP-N-acetyl-D-mannosaminuronate dehydrogenase
MEIINYKNYIDSFKTKEQLEREWRNSKLESTDFIVLLTDHPKHSEYLTYRQELRDYPSQPDFPNGQRPLKP